MRLWAAENGAGDGEIMSAEHLKAGHMEDLLWDEIEHLKTELTRLRREMSAIVFAHKTHMTYYHGNVKGSEQ